MPAPPKVGDRLGAVRRIEILGEDEAEHQPQADCHVGVTAEIEVDLKRIGHGAGPRIKRADRACAKRHVRYFAARIREQDLFREPEHEERDAPRELVAGQGSIFHLLREKGKFQDRSGDQVRRHGDETREVDEVGHRFRFTAVDIDRVAHRLEGVEADPEREDDAEKCFPLPGGVAKRPDDFVISLDPEVEILEEGEHEEVCANRDGDREVLLSRSGSPAREGAHRFSPRPPNAPGVVHDDDAHQPIQSCRCEHQRHEPWFGPTIKNVTRDDQPEIPPPLRRTP